MRVEEQVEGRALALYTDALGDAEPTKSTAASQACVPRGPCLDDSASSRSSRSSRSSKTACSACRARRR
eukprot:4541528-Pleurochrysis_carterae.AAC.1